MAPELDQRCICLGFNLIESLAVVHRRYSGLDQLGVVHCTASIGQHKSILQTDPRVHAFLNREAKERPRICALAVQQDRQFQGGNAAEDLLNLLNRGLDVLIGAFDQNPRTFTSARIARKGNRSINMPKASFNADAPV